MGTAGAESGKSFRDRLLQVLEDRTTHYVFLALLIVDVAAVIAGGYLETAYMESKFEDSKKITIACIKANSGRRLGESAVVCALPDHYGNAALHDAEVALIYVSIAILSTFVLEHTLHIFATSFKHCSDWRHLFDLAVVVVSMGIELAALVDQKVAVSAGVLALARLWRFARIIHGTAEVTEDIIEDIIEEGKTPRALEQGPRLGVRIHVADSAQATACSGAVQKGSVTTQPRLGTDPEDEEDGRGH
jgi:hypothetical protein